MGFQNRTFNQGETTLADLAGKYFKTAQDFTHWMTQAREEFGNISAYAFLQENPAIGMSAVAGQIALSTGGPVKKLEITAP